MDTPTSSKRGSRQLDSVRQQSNVRRSPRFSGRYQLHGSASSGLRQQSLGRSSLTTTRSQHSSGASAVHDTQGNSIQASLMVDNIGQPAVSGDASRQQQSVAQSAGPSGSSQHKSSTTGQPYVGSPVTIGTDSSEESDGDHEYAATRVSRNGGTGHREVRPLQSHRSDMPSFGLDDDSDMEYVTRHRYIHHKEKVITPPRPSVSTDVTDGAGEIGVVTLFKNWLWTIGSYLYLIPTFILCVDVFCMQALHEMLYFFQTVSDIRKRSFGSFCYLVLLTCAVIPLVCMLCGIQLLPAKESAVVPQPQPPVLLNDTSDFVRRHELSALHLLIVNQLRYEMIQNFNKRFAVEIFHLYELLSKTKEDLTNDVKLMMVAKLAELDSTMKGKIEVVLNKSHHVVTEEIKSSEARIVANAAKQHEEDMQNISVVLADKWKEIDYSMDQLFVNVTKQLEALQLLFSGTNDLRDAQFEKLENNVSNISTELQALKLLLINNAGDDISGKLKEFQDKIDELKKWQSEKPDIEKKMVEMFMAQMKEMLSNSTSPLNADFDARFAKADDVKTMIALLNATMFNLTASLNETIKNATESKPQVAAGEGNRMSNEELENRIGEVVDQKLELYSSPTDDKFDFALSTVGGHIVDSSGNYMSTLAEDSYWNRLVQYLNPTFWSRPPSTILEPGIHPGECWAFPGQKGFVVIELVRDMFIEEVVIEHIPKSISPYKHVGSAPKDYSVLVSHDLSEEWNQVQQCIYHAESIKEPCRIQNAPKNSIRYVRIEFQSNHGSGEFKFTCVYRVMVHGRLDSKDKTVV